MKSQARTTLVRQLSQRPWAILASELADSGAMTSRSAHLRRPICSTGSPLFCQTCHSSSSPAEECCHSHSDSFIRQFRHEAYVCLKGLSFVPLSNSKFQSIPHQRCRGQPHIMVALHSLSLSGIETEPGLACKKACTHGAAGLRPMVIPWQVSRAT